jgi:uncharacterized protein (DUF2267 family)
MALSELIQGLVQSADPMYQRAKAGQAMANELQMQEAYQRMQDQQGLRQLFQNNPNPEVADVMRTSPEFGMKYQQSRLDQRDKDMQYISAAQKVYAQYMSPISQDYFDMVDQGMPKQQAEGIYRAQIGEAQAEIEKQFGIKPMADFTKFTPEQIAERAHALGVDVPYIKKREMEQQARTGAQWGAWGKMQPSYGEMYPSPQLSPDAGGWVTPPSRGPGPTGGMPQGNPFQPAGAAPQVQGHVNPDAAAANHRAQGMTPEEFHARLNALTTAAKAAGFDVSPGSGYRSIEQQQQIYDRNVAKYGSANVPGHQVARPGHSMHNFDLANDLKFGSPAARQWAHANAGQFGLHFPIRGESWHVEAQPGWHSPHQAPTQVAASAVVPVPGLMTTEGRLRLQSDLNRQEAEARIAAETAAAAPREQAKLEGEQAFKDETAVNNYMRLPSEAEIEGLIKESISGDVGQWVNKVNQVFGTHVPAADKTAALKVIKANMLSSVPFPPGQQSNVEMEQRLESIASPDSKDSPETRIAGLRQWYRDRQEFLKQKWKPKTKNASEAYGEILDLHSRGKIDDGTAEDLFKKVKKEFGQ